MSKVFHIIIVKQTLNVKLTPSYIRSMCNCMHKFIAKVGSKVNRKHITINIQYTMKCMIQYMNCSDLAFVEMVLH